MKIEVKVSNEPQINCPYIGICTDNKNTIVLFTGKDSGMFIMNDGSWPLFSTTDINEEYYKPFNGQIVLSND